MEIYTDHFTSAKVIYPQKLEKIKVWDELLIVQMGQFNQNISFSHTW